MKQYFVTVIHTAGRDILEITARNEAEAIQKVKSAAGCPAPATITAKEKTGITFDQYGDEFFLFDNDTQTIITHI